MTPVNSPAIKVVRSVRDQVSAEEWQTRVDLAACSHLHPANLQVLMAADAAISAWPTDHGLAAWLASALRTA